MRVRQGHLFQIQLLAVLFIGGGVFISCSPQRLFDAFQARYSSEEDCGFVQNVYGQRTSWNRSLPISLSVHESFPTEFLPALDSAIRTWENAVGRKLFQIVETQVSGPLQPRQDGKSMIYWMNIWESDRSMEQGRTTLYWFGDQINEADLRINAKDFQFYQGVPQNGTAVHIESLLIHELGHVLGLKHEDLEASVMATYLPAVTERIELAPLDLRDLKCEY